MDSTVAIAQLRSIIADDTLPLTERRQAAAHLQALKDSLVDMTIPDDDPELLKLKAPWPRDTEINRGIADRFHSVSGGMPHDEAVAKTREHRTIAARVMTARDVTLHRLERLAAVQAYLDSLSDADFWRVNNYSAERLLDNLERTGNFGGVSSP